MIWEVFNTVWDNDCRFIILPIAVQITVRTAIPVQKIKFNKIFLKGGSSILVFILSTTTWPFMILLTWSCLFVRWFVALATNDLDLQYGILP